MITERDLLTEIEQCQKEPITDKKFDRLASCFVVYDHLFGRPMDSGYSYENKVEKQIYTNGGTEFLEIINGKDTEKVMAVLDELMEATKTLHPRMYDRVIEKINDI
jgi:hypothetical protein